MFGTLSNFVTFLAATTAGLRLGTVARHVTLLLAVPANVRLDAIRRHVVFRLVLEAAFGAIAAISPFFRRIRAFVLTVTLLTTVEAAPLPLGLLTGSTGIVTAARSPGVSCSSTGIAPAGVAVACAPSVISHLAWFLVKLGKRKLNTETERRPSGTFHTRADKRKK